MGGTVTAPLVIVNPQVPGGPISDLPAASLGLARTLFWLEDTNVLLRCLEDGSAWIPLTSSGGGGGSAATASGTLTVLAGNTAASTPHGLPSPLVAAAMPSSDTLGCRWWDGFDATNISVTLDHAQTVDINFGWIGVAGGGGGGGGGVGSIPVVDLIPGIEGDLVRTVGGVTVWDAYPVIPSEFRYVHSQGSAASTWNITHNLGGFPNVTVVDSANTKVEGGVFYVDSNNIQLSFSAPFSGQAYLS